MLKTSDEFFGHGYPRPRLCRDEWICLNGPWDFALDPDAEWSVPDQVAWSSTIQVPFSPETARSGVEHPGFFRACWYRRQFDPVELNGNQRLILHFGAVDYEATVWLNGRIVAIHEGGYTPFEADLTDFLTATGPQTLIVRAEDDPFDLAKPRGKQDWQLEAHSIWYPRTSGIWQTVWLESVPATRIGSLRMTPSVEKWEIGLEARIDGVRREDLRLNVKLTCAGKLISDDTYTVAAGEVHRRIGLSDPGIDDSRNELLWSPDSPTLIDVELRLWQRSELIDEAHSYTALRAIGVQGDRFVLNGRPFPLRMVLDQGYWPESGQSAPDDAALRRDVELAKAMGFNGVRKHQKIEDPRYLYWADRLGLLVWEEMPSAYRYTKRSIHRLTKEWLKVIERDVSHPCIVAWVPFNESWGVPDLPDSPAQRHYVQALYHMTKTLDPTRPVIGNDGWESVATDIIGIHDYDDQPDRIGRRYATDESLPRLFKRERPGGRILVLDQQGHTGQPIMLTEFGGVAFSREKKGTWGYSRSDTIEAFTEHTLELLSVIRSLPILAGFCYTQFSDTYQEVNGLLFGDRTPKIALADIALAVQGPRNEQEAQIEWEWRDNLMNLQRQQYLVPQEDYQQVHDRR